MEINKIYQEIILKLNTIKFKNQQDLNYKIRKIAGSFNLAAPAKIQLLSAYHKLIKRKILKPNENLEKFLKKRGIRTLSGVAPIAVLTKPYDCPGQCVFCPTQKSMPKSYLSNEPAVMRAVLCEFDPFKQVQMRLRALKQTGHQTDKCELIIMGGTWSYLPTRYQNWFIKRCFDGFNKKTAKNITQAQKWNETTKYRVIGLTLETRPDYINEAEIMKMRNFGCTKVELGVQSINDEVLKKSNRGHLTAQTIKATKLLKDAGFKITYHLMPNLPGSTPVKDFAGFKKLFTDPKYQPDMLKIYPCVLTADSKLFKLYKQKKYLPYTDKQLLNLMIKIKKIVPPYIRITRLIRDIPSESIIAGNKISNLRQIIHEQMKNKGEFCQCIRCREARNTKFTIKSLKLNIIKYQASGGWEYFLSYESKDKKTLFAFLRLRIPESTNPKLIKYLPELENASIIREVHTYGELIPLGSNQKAVQHAGLGKKLIEQGQKISKKHKLDKIIVISGIGVRQYYKKLGYHIENTYMVKKL